MLSKLFEEAYKQMYKQWVLNKIICMPNSISLFYEIPKKNDFRSLNCDEVLSYFSAYFNKYLNDIKLREEFTSYYKKSCLFSFIKYIFDENDVMSSFGDNAENRSLCYINKVFSFLVSEYFIVPEGAEKECIVFDGSLSNEQIISKLYLAKKYNPDICYKFDKGYYGSYVFDVLNYILPDYMWFALYIKGSALKGGKKVLSEYFKLDISEREGLDSYYLDKNWNLFEVYSMLIDYCKDSYIKDTSVNHGYFSSTFEDLLGADFLSYEESLETFICGVVNILDAFIISESGLLNEQITLDAYPEYGDCDVK